MVGRQRDGQPRSQIPRRAVQDRPRRRATAEDLSVSDSARLHLWAQLNVSNVELVRQPEFGNRSPRLLVAEPRMRRASKEKECRARVISSLLHDNPSSRSSASKVARLPQSITARHKDSQKAGSRDNQKKRHRHGHNNFGAITPAAPEVKTPEPFFAYFKVGVRL